jgi:hypothetical protein
MSWLGWFTFGLSIFALVTSVPSALISRHYYKKNQPVKIYYKPWRERTG